MPEEAEVVRTIFRYYLDGMSTHQIKEYLEENNFKTFSGLSTWQHGTILSILQNEKYCGDVIYQKTYRLYCLSKKVIVNNGDKTKYHIMNDHEPIVTRDLFYAVQAEFAKRNTKRSVSDKAATIRGRYTSRIHPRSLCSLLSILFSSDDIFSFPFVIQDTLKQCL